MDRTRKLVLVAGVLAGMVTGSAMAYQQPAPPPRDGGPGGPGGRGFGRMAMGAGGMMTEISSGQFDRYLKMLDMSDEQQSAAKTLFDGYRNEIKQLDEEMRSARQAAMEKFRETQDRSAFESMRGDMEKSREKRDNAASALMGDVKVLLTADQQGKWAKVERAQRRDQSLSRGRLAGEAVDLSRLVEDLKLDSGAAKGVAPILDRYETELDREMAARNTVIDKSMQEGMEAFRNRDVEKAQELFDKARDASVKVRDINRNFARQVGDALPADRKGEFEQAFKRASFPEVYRPTLASRRFEGAEKLADLTSDQRASIAELRTRFERDLASTNDKLAQAIESRQMSMGIQGMFGRGGPDGEDDPVAELRTKRRDLSQQASESLNKVLTDAQREKLPSADERDENEDGQPRRMRGMGGPGGPGGMGGRRRGAE